MSKNYTHCAWTCPRIREGMGRAQEWDGPRAQKRGQPRKAGLLEDLLRVEFAECAGPGTGREGWTQAGGHRPCDMGIFRELSRKFPALRQLRKAELPAGMPGPGAWYAACSRPP